MNRISNEDVSPRDNTEDFNKNITPEESSNETFETREDDPLNPIPGKDVEEKRTCSELCKDFFKNITVEPTVSLFIIAFLINSTAVTNLSLEKACRVNLNFTDDICTAMRQQKLNNQNTYERDVQRLVSTAVAWKTYLTATIPCALALFVGPWQDKTGRRKIFFIIPILGQILAGVNNILNAFFLYELNLEALVFSDALIEALTGGTCIIGLTVFAFISAITSEKSRTFRMGMVNFCFTVSFPVGAASSGFLVKNLGYYGTFGVAISIHLINLMYNTFILKDPERSNEQKQHDNKGVGHFFRTFFDLGNVRDAVVVVFKNGPGKRRARMIIFLVIIGLLYGPMFGESAVVYLSTRYRFNWDEVNFSLFQSYNFLIHTIGTIFSITVLSKILQWHDSMLGIISTVSKVTAAFVYCFAVTSTVFYIGPVVEILSGTSLLALRSIVSKIVATNELGKVNSIFGLVENLMPLVYVPLYTKIYRATMEVLPGAVFLVGGAMTVPAVIVFIGLFIEHRIGLKKNQDKEVIDVATPLTS